MGLAKRAVRWLGVQATRKIAPRVRRVVAPVLPMLITPVALGAAVSAGAFVFFLRIADDIREQNGVWRFDHDGLRLGLRLRNPRRTALMHGVSALARPDVMTVLGLVGILAAWRLPRYRAPGILLATTLTGGGTIIGGIKHRFARERPSVIEALASEGTFSFPSGHAFIALSFYGTLAFWWIRSPRHWLPRAIVGLTAAKGILLIGASRVYLGVHYPSDVLAGYATAIPWLTACLTAYTTYERRLAPLLDAAPTE